MRRREAYGAVRNIPQAVLDKIRQSDIFVGDLTTTVASIAAPNPNVVFDLGYAVAGLGWPRIVMLFNKAFGKFPNDLPFDVDRQRASPTRSVTIPLPGKPLPG